MKRITKYFLLLTVLLMPFIAGCRHQPTFEVEGSVAGAAGQTLFLEHQGLQGATLLDSMVLNEEGHFKFKEDLPEYPEYYRLRLGQQQIPFAVDSVNKSVLLTADARSFATSYTVEGNSASEQIREVWLANLDANVKTSRLIQSLESGIIDEASFRTAQDSILNVYKSLATKYIYASPASSVAYYALFQQVNGQLIFNLYDPQDSKAFAAVANVMSSYFPENPRSKHLYDLALRSIAVVRKARTQAPSDERLRERIENEDLLQVVGILDFSLPQLDGTELSLSEASLGHPTLLCFTTMSAEWAGQLNEILLAVHNKYSDQGLRIFQVGLDTDNHIWRNSVAHLPWFNVQDRKGFYSELVGLYNVNTLPTIYLLNKEAEIVTRVTSFEELPTLVQQVL